MLLVFDVGNSTIKAACYAHDERQDTWRISLATDDWREGVVDALAREGVEQVGLCSVVPAVASEIRTLITRRGHLGLTIISPELRLPFEVRYETPHTLGADRLSAAAAGWRQHGAGIARLVVIDAGTALTYEVIDAPGVYLGGAIAPGPELMRRSLASGTAQLPDVEIGTTDGPIGTSTRGAIRAGIFYTFVEGVRGMLHVLCADVRGPCRVVATGGWAAHLHEHIDRIDLVSPHLVVDGIQILVSMNNAQQG